MIIKIMQEYPNLFRLGMKCLNRRLDGDSLVILHSLECTAQESPTSTKLGNFKGD